MIGRGMCSFGNVVGLTRSRKSANHRAEFLLAAPQLLIALASLLVNKKDPAGLPFPKQSQLCTLHSIARQCSEYFAPSVPAVKIDHLLLESNRCGGRR